MCNCIDGFYDDNLSQDCKSCHYTCKTCILSNARTQCKTCESSKNRLLSSNQQECICKDGYYDDDINQIMECLLCDSTCLTCNGGASN